MAEISRYVTIQAIKTKDNELVPIWDSRVSFEEDEENGNSIHINGKYRYQDLVKCIFDLATKKVEVGIELDYYPLLKDLRFKKGEVILYEGSSYNRTLHESKITAIEFEKFNLTIKEGSRFQNYEKEMFPDLEIKENIIYAIREWKPIYILEDGERIDFELKLYHKA